MMDGGSCELHSEDDKALLEKNKKMIVKTRAQVEALEKFYDEHKYPSESMKIHFAKSISLTEKQVSGWFCHRRLKDKRLMNGENLAIGKQDRSSGVIQDRGSGHRQDSCGSTKLVNDKHLETREVESLRYDHNVKDDASSGSSSSLRNMPNSNNHIGDHFDLPSSRYVAPKVPMDVNGLKPRPGPSGYLKVKGNIENAAITAVKRQLGKHYRVDGPPLGIEFDPLPPGAFESSMQEPVDETYNTKEAVLPASPDISKIHQQPKFGKGCKYNSSVGPLNSNTDQTSFNTAQGSNIPNTYFHQKSRKDSSSARDIPGSESRDEYEMRHRHGVEVMRMDSISSHHFLQSYGGKVRDEREDQCPKYHDVSTKVSQGEKIENESFNLSTKGYGDHNSLDKVLYRKAAKDCRANVERRMLTENRVRSLIKHDTTASKRTRDEFPQHQHLKRLSVMDNQPGTHRVIRYAGEMPYSVSRYEQSTETSSSVD